MHKHTRAFAPSCAYVKINEDGTIGLITSAMDIGQGSSTILAQITAEEFSVPLEDVVLARPDTDATPFDTGTMSSRITFHVGNAVKLAAADVRHQIIRLASDILEAKPSDLVFRDKKIYVLGTPEKSLSLAELAAISHTFKGGPILGRGSYLQEDLTPLDLLTGQGVKPVDYWKYGACATEVELDEETGQVHILRLVASADAGFAINPLAVEGQIQGAVAMGLGGAVMEEMVFEGGRLLNPSLMDYNLPTALDVPVIEPVIIEVDHPDGPFGAKGIGEVPTPVVAPAIANALANAFKARIKDMPLTPEKVFWALKERDANR
jgi:carbon-monoxide dehydrogenase large subunit